MPAKGKDISGGPGAAVVTLEQIRQHFYDPVIESTGKKSSNRQFIQTVFAGADSAFIECVFGTYNEVAKESTQRVRFRRILRSEEKSSSRKAVDYLMEQTSERTGQKYSFDTLPLLGQLEQNWTQIFQLLPPGRKEQSRLADALMDFYMNDLSNEPPLEMSGRIASIADTQPARALAALTLWGCIAFSWNEGKLTDEQKERLSSLLLPVREEPGAEAGMRSLEQGRRLSGEEGCTLRELEQCLRKALQNRETAGEAGIILYRYAVRQKDPVLMERFRGKAAEAGDPDARYRQSISRARQLQHKVEEREQKAAAQGRTEPSPQSCRDCRDIVRTLPRLSGGDNRIRGWACSFLARYGDPRERADYAAECRLCGCEPMQTDEAEQDSTRVTPRPVRGRSAGTGICFTNAENACTRVFEKTIPESWGGGFKPFTFSEVREALTRNTAVRFLFAADDFSGNLHDTLDLIQYIQDLELPQGTVSCEIYARVDRGRTKAIIDTAIGRNTVSGVRVYLLDDKQWPAQQLLYAHPLFAPIRNLSLSADSGIRPRLRFIVIGDDPVAQELVREAFWMLEFRDQTVETEIVVLTTDEKKFEAKLKSQFPGMREGAVRIDGVHLPGIDVRTVDLNTYELEAAIGKLCFPEHSATPFCYFAVATEDDLQGLAVAGRIREILVRHALQTKTICDVSDCPPVAFLCRDDAVAWNSRRLVIENETYGDQWFNTWALIPFGNRSAQYTWDNLGGGVLEQLAECIHLQYEGLAWDSPDREKNLNERYFRHQYNMESSFAVALSLPYRLFQFRDAYGKPCIPDGWNILDDAAYATAEGLRTLAVSVARLGSEMLPEQEMKAVARWEHNRWVKWMLSRGWLPMTAECSAYAYQMENDRHYVSVARMHPCICSYEDQVELSRYLQETCQIKKDFFTYDEQNICATVDILEMKWLTEKEGN